MLCVADPPSTLPSQTELEPQGKAHVLLTTAPWFSHVNNLRIIALDLVRRGYEVTFMTGSIFKDTVEKTGATFIPLSGNADFDCSKMKEFLPEWGTKGGTVEQIERDFGDAFIIQIAAQHASIQAVLRDLARCGNGPVVLLHDNLFLGALPIIFGAPGIRPPILCIGITPLMNCSIDTAPSVSATGLLWSILCHWLIVAGTGLPPEEGRIHNATMNAGAKQALASLTTVYGQVMQSLGVTKPIGYVFDDAVLSPDRYLQLSIKDLEYPRSDLRKDLQFVGTVSIGLLGDTQLPPWWDLIVDNKKPLIVVTQVTLSNDPENLTIPALEALHDLDVLVIATLVRTDHIEDYAPPANVKIAQWIPFKKLFPYASVVINNGGCGTINLALSLGIPLVLAGLSEDIKEANARTAWTGAAIDLRSDRPTPSAIQEAVQKVLENPRYKARAVELQAEYRKCDSLGDIAAAIDEMGNVDAEHVEIEVFLDDKVAASAEMGAIELGTPGDGVLAL